MILMARILGVPLKVPTGKMLPAPLKGVLIVRLRAVDVRDDMYHVFVAHDAHGF